MPVTKFRMKRSKDGLKTVCPACGTACLKADDGRNAHSRFCHMYICTRCGVQEAFRGFFWIDRALARGARLNDAGVMTAQRRHEAKP